MKVRTMQVWRKSDSQPVVLNTSQYDDELYFKLPPKKKVERKAPKKVSTSKLDLGAKEGGLNGQED